ncbi:MAG: beta-propeller domain-containing protein [Granulosicoccus sp.]
MNRYTPLAAVVTVTLLSACSSGESITDPVSTGGNVPVGGEQDLRKLRVIESSDAFYQELKGALIAQTSGSDDVYAVSEGQTVNTTVADSADAPAAPQASPNPTGSAESTDSDAAAGSGGRQEVTGTNVQEIGVDEQDRVKNSSDGRHLYVLHNDYPEVYPVDGPLIDEPPSGVPLEEPVDSVAGTSPAYPQNFSTVLRILQLDAETPDATPIRDVVIDLAGRSADGMYLHENGDQQSILLTSTGGGYWENWQDPAAFSGLDSVITRIDVSDPANAAVTGNFRIDGQIISSRRIGKYMFFASRFYPTIPGVEPWSQTPEEWEATVEAADLSTLLPQYTNDGSDTITPLVDPAGCFVAEKPENDQWYSPDIITLGVIDLNTMDLTDSECYLGATETLYASPNAVYLATTKWDYSYGRGGVPEPAILEEPQIVDSSDTGDATQPAPEPYYDPRVDTDIHQFDINGGSLVYIGSGNVRGHLGWNPLRKPFRMSEHNGYLRVATFSDELRPGVSPINVSVLEADGQGSLVRIAELPNEKHPEHIGKPGEQLYASRFLGDRAYLVTFRQTDPLYVVDLSNPADPFLAGELEIAGYSDYLQPIGESFLLGIGKDAVAANDGWGDGRGALAQGVKLSLFDVSDVTAPREVQSVIVGQRGTEATALHNHRAITIQSATDQHPTRVAFGIDVAGNAIPDSQPSGDAAFEWHQWSYTGLHGFEVRTGSDAGITTTGVLRVENANGPYSYPRSGDDRSVMVNDSVFYIHGANVWSAPWNDMANPVGPR